MATSFTTNQSGAPADYLKYVTSKFEKSHRKNSPRLLDFTLSPVDGSFVKLNRGTYITVNSDKYGKWFTGYITNEPEFTYLGSLGGVSKYGYKYEATSDEYILNIKPLGILPPFINKTQGAILKDLIELLAPGIFDTTGIQNGLLLARYVAKPDKNFLDVVKEFANSAVYSFWAHDKKAYFAPQDTLTGGFTLDGNNSNFTPSQLSVRPNDLPIINDCVVLGDIEPKDYITEMFVGDGLSARFPLIASVFGTDRAVFLDEDFSASQIDQTKWTVYDQIANYLQVDSGYLNCLGGVNDGAYEVHIDSAQLIPLEGTLRFTHGEWDILSHTSGRKGVIAGLWTGAPAYDRTGCVYGIEVNSDGTNITLKPIVNAALDGTQSVTVDTSKRYLMRTIVNTTNLFRVEQGYAYLDQTGTRIENDGTNAATKANFHTTIVEVDPTNGTVTNTFTWDNNDVAVANTSTYALYTPIAANDLHVTVTGITISAPLAASLAIKASGGTTYDTKPLGPNEMDTLDGQSAVATIADTNNGASTKSSVLGTPQYNPGQAALTFFKDTSRQVSTTPQPGDVLRARYRRAGAAMGHVQNRTSVESEATSWGDNGLRSLVKNDIDPKPRTSSECEQVAGVIVGESSYQHFVGSYTQWSDYFTNEPVAGAIITFANLPSSLPSTLQAEEITDVSTTFECNRPSELFQHKVSFGGNSRLELLLRRYVKQADVFTPEDTAEIPDFVDVNSVGQVFAADITAAEVTSWDANNFTIDTKQAAPSGGGFEARLSDASWGADDGKNLITRTASQTFTVPRNNRNKAVFIRAYDARNKCLYSEDLTNAAWVKTSCTATKFTGINHAGDLSFISQLAFSGAGTVNQDLGIVSDGLTATGTIDLKGTGTVTIAIKGATSGSTTQSVALTGGWKRVSVTRTFTTGGGNIVFEISTSGAITIDASRASVELASAETVYCKTVSTVYGALSRNPAALRISFPFVPPEIQNLSGVMVDQKTIKFDYDLPTDDTVYDIYKVQMEDQSGNPLGEFQPDYTSVHQTNLLAVPSTFTVAAGDTIYVKSYNVLGESSDLLTGFSTGTTADPGKPGVVIGADTQDDGMIHVREYGAVGDGSTDDTAAIQAALNAAGNVTSESNGSSNLVLSVSVPGNTMPWLTSSNPSLNYGINDGRTPVILKHTLIAGQAITITATGTVKPSDSRPYVGPDGQSGVLTGDTLGSSGTYFPSHYVSPNGTIQLAMLMGAFTDSFGVVVQAVAIGAGPITLTVPAGATLLQLGINDDHFSDNLGSFSATVTIFGQTNGVGLSSGNRKIVFMPSDMVCGVGSGSATLTPSITSPYGPGTLYSTAYWMDTSRRLIWMKSRTGGDPSTGTFSVLSDSGYSEFTTDAYTVNFNTGGPSQSLWIATENYILLQQGVGYGYSQWVKVNWSGTYQGTFGHTAVLTGTPIFGTGAVGKISGNDYLATGVSGGSDCWLVSVASDFVLYPSQNDTPTNTASPGGGPLVWDNSGYTYVFTSSTNVARIDWSTNPGTVTNYTVSTSGSPQSMRYVPADNTLLLFTANGIYKFDLSTHTITNSLLRSYEPISDHVASNNLFAFGVDLINALTLAVIEDQNIADFSLPNPVTTSGFGRPYDSESNTIYLMDDSYYVYGLVTSVNLGPVLAVPSNVDFLIDGTLKLLPFIAGGYIISSQSTSNVRIRGRGSIQANDSTYHSNRTGGGLYFKNCTNLRVQDLSISGVNKDSSIHLEIVDQCWVHDVTIDGTVATVAQPGLNVVTLTNAMIESNMIRNCPDALKHSGITESVILGNIFSNCTTEFSPSTFDNTTIVHSTIYNGGEDRRYVQYIMVNSTELD